MTSELWKAIAKAADEGLEPRIPSAGCSFQPVGGGCIHQSWKVTNSDQSWFVKTNGADHLDMFQAESAGLMALSQTGTIRVPKVLACGVSQDTAWLILEHLELRRGSDSEFREMGRQLATLHRCASPETKHGWTRSNFIGSTPQFNRLHASWLAFFRDERLAPQFDLSGDRFVDAGAMLNATEALLSDHEPPASPLHGDLWAGNAAFGETGDPVVFDPAFYWGDRETDLAFTGMFGGFPPSFYDGYDAEWPRPVGYEERVPLYNLYHLLNHHHLFGEPYGHQADQAIQNLLKKADSLAG